MKMLLLLLGLVLFDISIASAQMPAARLGDQTDHGGVITQGSPTVLINGQPAARVADMVVCPMVTALVPHVGGPISSGSQTVLIGGLPAARVGSTVTEVGPTSTVVTGSASVLIGN
jgi:uncharacterized Zn-binding protein involved in type VI secretion